MGRTITISEPIMKIIHGFSFCALVIAGSAYAYYLSKHNASWTVKSGCKPEYDCNAGFFNNFAAVGFCIISFLYAIFEILMLIQIQQAKKFDVGLVKPVIYCINGICALGVCGDLGIAAGSLVLIAGAFWLVLTLYVMIS